MSKVKCAERGRAGISREGAKSAKADANESQNSTTEDTEEDLNHG
jgi:hypothetical protein